MDVQVGDLVVMNNLPDAAVFKVVRVRESTDLIGVEDAVNPDTKLQWIDRCMICKVVLPFFKREWEVSCVDLPTELEQLNKEYLKKFEGRGI